MLAPFMLYTLHDVVSFTALHLVDMQNLPEVLNAIFEVNAEIEIICWNSYKSNREVHDYYVDHVEWLGTSDGSCLPVIIDCEGNSYYLWDELERLFGEMLETEEDFGIIVNIHTQRYEYADEYTMTENYKN